MSNKDENFLQKLRETFHAEAREHIQSISGLLLELEKAAPDALPQASVENVYRSVHSLKGAARSVGLHDIETICQSMESIFQGWKSRRTLPNHRVFDTLHHAVDALTSLLSGAESVSPRLRDDLVHRLDSAGASPPPRPAATPPPPADPAPARVPAAPLAPQGPQSVRVPVARLDAQLLQAEGMLSIKNGAVQHAADLSQALSQFDLWQARWALVSGEVKSLQQALQQHEPPPQVPASPQLIGFLEFNHDYIRSLQERLRELTLAASQDKHHIARSVDTLLQDSKELLMLPFHTIAEVFPKIVRDLCRDQGKQATLTIQAGEVALDKRILEETKDLFIHLLRNCIDHGIETPKQRALAGKPSEGAINISISRQGSRSVEITFSDDGAGINTQALIAAAIGLGQISPGQAQNLTDTQAYELMFLSGTSTSPSVNAISGRGLGMAIVQSKILGLGGTIHVQSSPGQSTTFTITLPSTLATFRGILVTAGNCACLIPSARVVRVLRVDPGQIQSVENRQTVSIDGRPVSLVSLHDILGAQHRPQPAGASALLPMILLENAGLQVAFLVDQVLHEEEVLVKPLPHPLKRIRNISGAAVIRSGAVAIVLDVPDLIAAARSPGQGHAPLNLPQAPVQARARRILVVEDSITSRMLIKGILESAGYDVQTAVDGVEAFTILREQPFDLVVSDVEMPRMTGLDLTARIRSEKRFEHLPVVLVTALESPTERERGIDAGANAYIIKSRFDQSNLLQVVERLI